MTGSAMLKPAPYTFTQQEAATVAPTNVSYSPDAAEMTNMGGPVEASLAQHASETGTRPLMKAPAGVPKADAMAQTEVAIAPDVAVQTVQVVRQCRAFAAAFQDAVSKERVVRELLAALGPTNIQATFASMTAEDLLTEEYVFNTLRVGAGYQPWFVAPEAGVRCLVKQTLELCRAPMQQSLSAAVDALMLAVDKAAERCSAAHASVLAGRDGRIPSGATLSAEEGSAAASQQALLEWLPSRAKQSIKGWQEGTWDKLEALLTAEACLPTPIHFIPLKEQLQRLLLGRQRQAAQRAAGAAAALLEEGSGHKERAQLGSAEAGQLGKASAVPVAEAEGDSYQVYFMGWLDKLSRHGKWQKRWFVLDGEQQCLYYFGSPEETPARAVVKLAGVMVMADDREPSSASTHKEGPPAGMGLPGGKVQHVFQLQLAGLANQAAGSNPAATVTLRCLDAPTKSQWVKQIRRVAEGPAKLVGPEALEEAGAPGSPAGSGLQGGAATAAVPRKISTRVFPEGAAPQQEGSRVAVPPSSGTETGLEGACREAGESAAGVGPEEAAAALVDDILRVHEQTGITTEDRELLGCIIKGTQDFIQAAHERLADLTGKVIIQGMLGHSDDLYCDLLEVLHDGLP